MDAFLLCLPHLLFRLSIHHHHHHPDHYQHPHQGEQARSVGGVLDHRLPAHRSHHVGHRSGECFPPQGVNQELQWHLLFVTGINIKMMNRQVAIIFKQLRWNTKLRSWQYMQLQYAIYAVEYVVVYAIYVVGSGTCSPGDGSALERVCRGTWGLDIVNFLHFQHK